MTSGPTHQFHSPLGLIAGNGSLPSLVVDGARAMGLDVVVVAHRGETSEAISEKVSKCLWVKVGELGKILDYLKSSGVSEVVLAGGIKRINLFGGVKLDLRGAALIARLRTVQDDAILRGIAEEIEKSGMKVCSPTDFCRVGIDAHGVLAGGPLSVEELRDVSIGWNASAVVGAADIGQTVVVNQGVVVAVEAVEGTDETIRRAGKLSGAGSIVVKRAKSVQDLRFDKPTVGPETLTVMKEAKARVLVVERSASIFLDQAEIITRAEKLGIAVVVIDSLEELILAKA